MGNSKKPHLRQIKSGKVIKVGLRTGEPEPVLTYNKPKNNTSSALIFKPSEVKKTD